MSAPMTAAGLLDRYFLEMRCKVLEVAAGLDRLEHAPDYAAISGDPRLGKLREAIATLLEHHEDRAERVLIVFSDPYDAGWQRPVSKR